MTSGTCSAVPDFFASSTIYSLIQNQQDDSSSRLNIRTLPVSDSHTSSDQFIIMLSTRDSETAEEEVYHLV
jgi:hypothetical protein